MPSNNSNWPLLNDKAINTALDKARLIPDPAAAGSDVREDRRSDHRRSAPSIPWIWDNFDNIESSDVAGVTNLFNASWDVIVHVAGQPVGR